MRTYRTKAARLTALVLRMALGLFFIVSAVAKWVDLDRFEIYVFSFQLFSLNTTFLLARLLIVGELLVGIGLLSNICHRFVNGCTVLLLMAFTLFLGYAILVGRTDSCQCMGAWVNISPTLSLLKNALLFLVLLPASRCQPWRWRPRWYVWLPVVLFPMLAVFITSAPDNWLFCPDRASHAGEPVPFLRDPALAPLQLDSGRQAVLFLTPGCRYCRLADQKVTAIRRRHAIDSTSIHYVISSRPTASSQTFSMPVTVVPDSLFGYMTGGMTPLLVLLENGRFVAVSHYRNIDEPQIVGFFDAK